MTNQEESFKRMEKLRKRNPQFDNLVSQIDAEFEKYIENLKNTSTYLECSHKKSFYDISLKIVIPYVKITDEECGILQKYLQVKYKRYGDYFIISKQLFRKRFQIINFWET